MAASQLLFPPELPEGFLYQEEFLTEAVESELLRIFRGLDFVPYEYRGFLAKRRIVRYGANYDLKTSETEPAPGIPEFLSPVQQRAAEFAGVPPGELVHAMVAEYSAGTPIGWHRDAPQFGMIIGISLASACRMRFKPYRGTGKILSLQLEPRSIYVMKGPARSDWQHSIPAVEELRYSITFRTLRNTAKRKSPST